MGIRRLYRSLVERYPLIRRMFNDPSRPQFDSFYIDFVSVIYICSNVVSPNSPDEFPALISEILRYLDILVHLVQPHSLIYIAVDGVPPFAKTVRQRARRLLLSQEGRKKFFDSAQVVPGSEFMELLHESLERFIKNKHETDPIWKRTEVHYSSYHTPGEGEQKIMKRLKEEQKNMERLKEEKHQRSCIFTPDSDMILLALRSMRLYCCILRSKNQWRVGPETQVGNASRQKLAMSECDFELLYLDILVEYLLADFPTEDVDFRKAWEVCDDFAAISLILGNDFLPPLKDIDMNGYELHHIIRVYKERVFEQEKKLMDGGKLQLDVFRAFLEGLAPDRKKSDKPAKRNICEKYMVGLNWVLSYYWGNDVNLEWHFGNVDSPRIRDLANFCGNEIPESDVGTGESLRPFELMMCVLSETYSDVVPAPLRERMMDVCNGGRQHFAEITYGPKDETPLADVKVIDLNVVRATVAKALEFMDEKDLKRNREDMPTMILSSTAAKAQTDLTDFYFPSMNQCVPNGVCVRFVLKQKARPGNKGSRFSMCIEVRQKDSGYHTQRFQSGETVLVDWPFWKRARIENVQESTPKHVVAFYSRKYSIELRDDWPCLECRLIAPANSDYSRFISHRKRILVPAVLCQRASPAIKHYFVKYEPWDTAKFQAGSPAVIIEGEQAGQTVTIVDIQDGEAEVSISPPSWQEATKQILEDDRWLTLEEVANYFDLANPESSWMMDLLGSTTVESGQDISFTVFSKKDSGEYKFVLDGFAKVSKRSRELMFHEDLLPSLKEYFEKVKSADVQVCGPGRLVCQQPQSLVTWIRKNTILSKFTMTKAKLHCFGHGVMQKLAAIAGPVQKCASHAEEIHIRIPVRSLVCPGYEVTSEQRAVLGSHAVVISCFCPLSFGTHVIVVGGELRRNSEDRLLDVMAFSPVNECCRDLLNERLVWSIKKGDLYVFG